MNDDDSEGFALFVGWLPVAVTEHLRAFFRVHRENAFFGGREHVLSLEEIACEGLGVGIAQAAAGSELRLFYFAQSFLVHTWSESLKVCSSMYLSCSSARMGDKRSPTVLAS